MLQVLNHTPFAAMLSVFPDPRGVETAYAVVKATFRFTPEGLLPQVPSQPLLTSDVYWGEPAASSLRAAGEIALLKPGTDVLLSGRAIAPAPDTRVADVGLLVGPVRRVLRVFGDRQWQRGLGGWRISEPQPWSRMPIQWERAFGGVAPARGKAPAEREARNPVGCGLVAQGGDPLEGQLLPNLEDPQALIQSPADRPTPACLAPIAPTWMPRVGFAGTYDEAWTQSRAPYLPRDFDPRYFHVAPPELIAPGFLQGGEPVRLIGFTVGEPLDFTLPQAGLDIAFDFDGAQRTGQPQLETVLFEPDAGRMQMLWRCALAVDKRLLKLRNVTVSSRTWAQDGRPKGPLPGLGRMPAGYAAHAAAGA
jgi:hypothetical protein